MTAHADHFSAPEYTGYMYSTLPPDAIAFVPGMPLPLAWVEGTVPAGFLVDDNYSGRLTTTMLAG